MPNRNRQVSNGSRGFVQREGADRQGFSTRAPCLTCSRKTRGLPDWSSKRSRGSVTGRPRLRLSPQGFPAVCGIPRPTRPPSGRSPGLFTVKSRSLPRHPLRGSRTGIAACSVVESRPSGRSRRSRNCRGMSKSGNLGIPDGKTRSLGSILGDFRWNCGRGCSVGDSGHGTEAARRYRGSRMHQPGPRRVGSEFPRSGFAVDDGGRRGIGRLLPAWRRQRIGHGIAVKAGERQ